MIRPDGPLGHALKTLSHGPIYAAAMSRIGRPRPLDPEENWAFWTRRRGAFAQRCLEAYPPGPIRNRWIDRGLAPSHEAGIVEHYDVSNDFYKLFLDKAYMFYSCADFHHEGESLEQAQRNKADHILGLIAPKPGESILELGCGWGAMLRRIREAAGDGVALHGYTLSRAQKAYNDEHLGFDVTLADFITADYPDEAFDAIYSIGAWEHVRPAEIPGLLVRLHRALKPGGRLVQHFFCLTGETPRPPSMLTVQIFFPGSILAPYRFQRESWEAAGFAKTHESTHDYRPTLRAWHENLVANRDEAIALAGVQTYNKYLVMFAMSWAFFDRKEVQVYRFILQK